MRHRLHRQTSGQALVFGALTLFCLVSFAAAAFDVGEVSATRIRVQNAADQAALAGAQVEADVLSEIAWINDGMAYVYYNLMRYAVDVTVYGVLAELKEHGPPYPTDALVGVTDPVGTYDEAYARGEEWIARGQQWIDHLEKLEAGISIAAPGLVRQEIFRVARAHGAEKVAVFPDLVFYPDPQDYLMLSITRLGGGGWSITDNNGYSVSIEILGEDSYRVTSTASGSFTVVRDDADHYTITSDEGTIRLSRSGLGWVVSGPDGDFVVEPGPNGGTRITKDGTVAEFRRGPDGTLQEFRDGQWQEMSDQQTLTIDGTEVPIAQGAITVGNARIELEPLSIGIDNLRITPAGNRLVIEGAIGRAWLRIDGDYAVVNGLSTRNADGKWRPWGGDRTRHRMTELDTDSWTYEMMTEGSVLQVEPNRERFGIVHAVRENDPGYLAGSGYPAWMTGDDSATGWFDPRTGSGSDDYHQTRRCWACGGQDPAPLPPPSPPSCPVCLDRDNDGDGATDVRKYRSDALDRDDPAWQSVNLPLPYVLTPTFFRFGINVGVWAEKSRPLLGFPAPGWGYFAFASAKAGFQDPDTGRFTYGMADLTARDRWVAEHAANLYQPAWEARLVPCRTAIRTDDIFADDRIDTGCNYLLRGFLDTGWFETADDRNPARAVNARLRAMASKDGRILDPLDMQFEQVLRH